MLTAPVWHMPTPWPQPAPRRMKPGWPALSLSVRVAVVSAVKTALLRGGSHTERILSSGPISKVPFSPTNWHWIMRPDGPRLVALISLMVPMSLCLATSFVISSMVVWRSQRQFDLAQSTLALAGLQYASGGLSNHCLTPASVVRSILGLLAGSPSNLAASQYALSLARFSHTLRMSSV